MSPKTPDPTHPLVDEASELRAATLRLSRRLRAERAVDSMSDGQFSVLVHLKIHGPQTLTELAERERVSAPSMTRTVNCLEEGHYLTRTPDTDDRRKVVVALSEGGAAVVAETVRLRDAWLEDALAELEPRERAVLAKAAPLMRRVADR